MKFRPYHASRPPAAQRPGAIDCPRDPGMSFPHPPLTGLFKNPRGGSDACASARFRVLAVIPAKAGIHFRLCLFASSLGRLYSRTGKSGIEHERRILRIPHPDAGQQQIVAAPPDKKSKWIPASAGMTAVVNSDQGCLFQQSSRGNGFLLSRRSAKFFKGNVRSRATARTIDCARGLGIPFSHPSTDSMESLCLTWETSKT